jgi:hypothetical protein
MLKYKAEDRYDLHCPNPRHFDTRLEIREDEQKAVRFCITCGKKLVLGLHPQKKPICGDCGKEVHVMWEHCVWCGSKL